MIGNLYHIKIMFNNKNRISLIGKALKNVYQLVNVSRMKSGSRLVEDIYRLSGSSLGKLG